MNTLSKIYKPRKTTHVKIFSRACEIFLLARRCVHSDGKLLYIDFN
jgi:hypothetical protein